MLDSVKMRRILFAALAGVVVVLSLYLLKPFFFPLFWAVVIAGLFQPLYRKLQGKRNLPSLNAAVTLILIIFILILPAGILATLLVNESIEIYNSIDKDITNLENTVRDWADRLAAHPTTARLHLNSDTLIERFTEVIKNLANAIFKSLTGFTQNTLMFLVKFAVMLYALFFFIRDGDRILQRGKTLFALGKDRESVLYGRFVTTARATLKVTFIIGGLQGFLGGILLYLVGIKGALTWGVVMVLTSIIPGVGCSIVWAPAGLLLLVTGHMWEGIIVILAGVLVISMVDNLFRPVLLGRDVQMHPLLIFLSTLGGIALFGISGFVIGPIVASLLLSILDMYEVSLRPPENP
ncbi:MAG: AI-2E family transporter [Syntrophaceae bacterium]|nr:AI-2E family transporter [Syntrophaceae bacterium]